ncbi:hypothetical protein QR680_010156 [Steinernema hermaphroditum]|uniref:Uncharacterized protein n=1 Tax=Steinernema hermaphroditum TaxID=289476 RepID=A0AA39IMZ1_9BILA|nr:hypothetical protein QR680_010156 [Steinernema hermaphroditum]
MARYVQVLLGLTPIWSLEEDTEQERLLSLSRVLNFLRPTPFNRPWRPVPLMIPLKLHQAHKVRRSVLACRTSTGPQRHDHSLRALSHFNVVWLQSSIIRYPD